MIEKIISGGQTGVDQIGLTVAQHLKIKTGGCAPKDFMTGTGPCESLKTLFGLREVTPEETVEFAKLTGKSDRYTARTYINARDSDGTVYFASDTNSPGSKTTKRGCNEYKKPFIMNPDAGQLVEFIRKNGIRILNVAGNRGSKLSSAYAKEIWKTLEEAVREVNNPKNSLMNPYNTYEVNGKRYKIYPNDYLMNHKFTPDEINTFIEDDEESYNIYASFTVNAWKFIKRPESELEALKMMSDDSEWFKKVTWTKEQRVEYEKDVHKILMNCIGLNSEESWNEVEYWLALGSSPGLDDYSDKNFSELRKMENELRYKNN